MGLLKKLTKPISKFLDKVVPNEIKPALPYLAAFAPFMMGPGAATGGWWQRALYNPATRAGIMGGLNIGSQLSQEGSEGEFSGLSTLLAAGTGAMTAGGGPEMFRGMQNRGTWEGVGSASGPGLGATYVPPPTDVGMMTSISDAIGKGGETASKFLIESGDILRPGGAKAGLNMETLGALGTPVSHGTGDLAFAEAQRANRDYERQMAADESESLIDDEGRRRAIRAAMEAAGHIEEDILDAIASLGLKEGGIVGLKHGGRIGFYQGGGPHGGSSQGNTGGTKGGNKGGWSPSVGRSKKGYLSGHPGGGTTTGGTGTDTTWSPSVGRTKTGYLSGPTGLGRNTLMADLTKKQIQMLKTSQKNLKDIIGISNEEILENIKGWDDPDDPATIENVTDYYAGTYKVKDGGRIGAEGGGIMHAKRGLVDTP